MERIKLSDNWYLDEFVDPFTYFNSLDKGRSLIHNEIIAIAQYMRELINSPCSINTWWKYYKEQEGKKSIEQIIKEIESSSYAKWSGLRTSRCTIGGKLSAHRNEGAIDIKSRLSGKQMFQLAEKNATHLYQKGARRFEHYKDTPTWLHIDRRERAKNKIAVVDPKVFCYYINII